MPVRLILLRRIEGAHRHQRSRRCIYSRVSDNFLRLTGIFWPLVV